MTDIQADIDSLGATLEVGAGEKAGRFDFDVPFQLFEDPAAVATLVASAGPTRADYEHSSLTLVVPDNPWSLALFAAVVGVGHSAVNVRIGDQPVPVPALINTARRAVSELPEPPKGFVRPEALVIAAHPTDDIFSRYSQMELLEIHKARHVVVVRGLAPLPRLFEDLAVVSGLRSQQNIPFRLPWVQIGIGEDSHVKLGEFRSAGFLASRDAWALKAVSELVEPDPDRDRMRALSAARKVDVRKVLEVLNSVSVETEGGERWRCVRPGPHTNGDRNPSMVVDGNRVRCFVCDPEPRDPVALVMSVAKMTPSEAALAILSAQTDAPSN